MATLFWVGGSTAYDGVTNRLATSSGGSATVAVIASGDSVTFDTNSGAAAVTTSAAISCTTLTTIAGFTGSLTMSNNLTVSGVTTHGAGTLSFGSNTISFGTFNSTAGTRTINLNTANITCTATGSAWNVTSGGVLTVNTNTAIMTLNGATSNFNSSTALDWKGLSVKLLGSGSCQFSGTGFKDVTLTGTASKSDVRTLSNNFSYTGTLTIGGNSIQGVNRLLVQSTVFGTQRTITATGAAVVINGDVDFMDVTITGSPSWTNAGSAYVGDALGNGSLITTNRTTSATQTATGTASFTWSTHGWTSRVPLPQDNVVINNAFIAGRVITVDMPRLGGSIDFTGSTGSVNVNYTLNTISSYGDLILVNGMTISAGQRNWVFNGRGSYSITHNGATWVDGTRPQVQTTGTYTITDDLVASGGVNQSTLTVSAGTMTINGNVTTGELVCSTGATLNMTSGVVTFNTTRTSSTLLVINGTLNFGTTTIVIAPASAVATTFTLGVGIATYTSITMNTANSIGCQLTLSGAATIGTINVGSGRVLTLPSGVTITTNTAITLLGTINGYLYLPGVSANYVSTPDSAALSIVGDITIDAKLALDHWVPSAECTIVGKWETTGVDQRSYLLRITTGGLLRVYWTTNGLSGTTLSATSSVATGFVDGTTNWIRATFQVNDGAGNRVVKFYTSSDGITWSQLGSTQTTVGVTNIFDSTSPLLVGADNSLGAGGNLSVGKFYQVRVYSDITQTTKVFDADFTTHNVISNNWLDTAKTQFTESSSNAATVTINGVLAQAGGGRVIVNSSTPGSAATISAAIGAVISAERISLQDSTATGGARFAAVQSVKVSNVTGWSVNENVGWGVPV